MLQNFKWQFTFFFFRRDNACFILKMSENCWPIPKTIHQKFWKKTSYHFCVKKNELSSKNSPYCSAVMSCRLWLFHISSFFFSMNIAKSCNHRIIDHCWNLVVKSESVFYRSDVEQPLRIFFSLFWGKQINLLGWKFHRTVSTKMSLRSILKVKKK